MKKCIVILSSPRHTLWTQLTKTSLELFWDNHPPIKIYGEDDNRDWLSTALTMSKLIQKEGYEIVHFFLADHAVADPVRKDFIIGAECSLGELFDAVSYRSSNEDSNIVAGDIVISPDHNFCLCPGVWDVNALVRNLELLDKMLTAKDQRTPLFVDKLAHAGIFPRTAMITGKHHTVPMPFHGALLNGKVFQEYELYYKNRPILLDLFKKASGTWDKK